LSSSYVETKTKELQLQSDCFEWEKKNRVEDRKEETRRMIMFKLIEQQKSPDTIQKFLNTLL